MELYKLKFEDYLRTLKNDLKLQGLRTIEYPWFWLVVDPKKNRAIIVKLTTLRRMVCIPRYIEHLKERLNRIDF